MACVHTIQIRQDLDKYIVVHICIFSFILWTRDIRLSFDGLMSKDYLLELLSDTNHNNGHLEHLTSTGPKHMHML